MAFAKPAQSDNADPDFSHMIPLSSLSYDVEAVPSAMLLSCAIRNCKRFLKTFAINMSIIQRFF